MWLKVKNSCFLWMLQDKDFSENTAFIKASLQIKIFCVTSQYLSITKSILAIQIVFWYGAIKKPAFWEAPALWGPNTVNQSGNLENLR